MCTVIEEKDVTTVNLSLGLEQAVISHEVDKDREIYITESGWFPFWIRIYRGNGQIVLTTYTEFRSNTSRLQRLELVNEVNSKLSLVSAYVTDQRLHFDHVLLFRDGLTRESFIRACRGFNDSLNRAITELNPDKKILMAPGEREASDQEQSQDPQ